MADVCVARQPIFDAQVGVTGYELLFRRGAGATEAGVVDAAGATANVLWNAFAELGLDTVVGERSAFVNVPWKVLVADPPLPAYGERIVIELLEGAPPTPEVVDAIGRAKARGHRVALDDFVFDASLSPLLDVADIVKVDLRSLTPDELEAQVATLAQWDAQLLAEKVETYDEFQRCRELGFDLFQGFFFARPRTLTRRTVPTTSAGRLALLAILQNPETSPEELATAIGRDAGLSYKLLRYMNSAFFSLPREVTSVREALQFLGMRAVRRWASLLLLSGIEDRPSELLVTALVRARTCELLASTATTGSGPDPDASYTAGLFSVVDAMLDTSMDAVLDGIPLEASVRRALLEHAGPTGAALAAVKSYERGSIQEIEPQLRARIGDVYLAALREADALGAALA